ncbi:MAG: class I SAM-dependent methyltransferase [Bacteroidetes bacterium]|nr:class I SAM-dependent methyltransferase [Bacteroidota bacterium]
MSFILSTQMDEYIEERTTPQIPVLQELDRETHIEFHLPQMLSGTVQGRFLEMVSKMMRPMRILEIGTFTGYSAICLALGLAEGGKLITIDINEELEDTVLKYIERAGMSDKIEFLIGQAKEIIPSLEGEFDMVFIDADKLNYHAYYDLVFHKLKMGGFILADNVLWGGKVVEGCADKDTRALIAFSDKVHNDDRVENVMLSIRDGIMMARKIKD